MSIQILYADTLLLSNLIMNYLALRLTGAVMHLRETGTRVFLSSLLGGVYAVLAVLLSFHPVLHIIAGGCLSALLLLIAFGRQGGGGLFFRSLALFYFSSVLLGGGIEALFTLLEGVFGTRASAPFRPADLVLLLGFLAYFILRGVTRFLSGGTLPNSVIVSIRYEEKCVSLPLLVDSGCRLADPITGKSAILISASALRTVLPREVLGAAERTRVTIPSEPAVVGRCRLLPMKGAGGEGLLLAFRADEVRLLSDGGTLDVWIALYTSDITRFGGCRGLCPSTLLYGRDMKVQTVSRSGTVGKGGLKK